MNIDAQPELFGKPNKSELMKHLEKCEQIVKTWEPWKLESIRNAFCIPHPNTELIVGSKVLVDFISESRTIFSGKRFTGKGVVDRLEDGRVFGRLEDGRPFMCFPCDVILIKGEEVMIEILDKATEELVDNFANAMKQKLLKAQIKYGFKSDWLNNDWEKDCQSQLNDHVLKGDPLDVGAYCAFMWFHNWKTEATTHKFAWNDVNDNLPGTEPNTDGSPCAVLTERGNVFRARYTHDIFNGGEHKYWNGFDVDAFGQEHEFYEVPEKVTHWAFLPDQVGEA